MLKPLTDRTEKAGPRTALFGVAARAPDDPDETGGDGVPNVGEPVAEGPPENELTVVGRGFEGPLALEVVPDAPVSLAPLGLAGDPPRAVRLVAAVPPPLGADLAVPPGAALVAPHTGQTVPDTVEWQM